MIDGRLNYHIVPGILVRTMHKAKRYCDDIGARVSIDFCNNECILAMANNCKLDVWKVHERMSFRNRYIMKR